MLYFDNPIHSRTSEFLFGTIRPENLDRIDLVHSPQTEVCSRIVGTLITLSWLDDSIPAVFAPLDADFGSKSVAMQSWIESPNDQPVPSSGSHVAKDASRSADLGDEQIESAVSINVPHTQTAADVGLAAQCRVIL
jgi:hypothetical protein